MSHLPAASRAAAAEAAATTKAATESTPAATKTASAPATTGTAPSSAAAASVQKRAEQKKIQATAAFTAFSHRRQHQNDDAQNYEQGAAGGGEPTWSGPGSGPRRFRSLAISISL